VDAPSPPAWVRNRTPELAARIAFVAFLVDRLEDLLGEVDLVAGLLGRQAPQLAAALRDPATGAPLELERRQAIHPPEPGESPASAGESVAELQVKPEAPAS
jgi:hypothetical protein